jgi:DNA-binding HxlR family transcriptional regulator/putative sterol carrier protein
MSVIGDRWAILVVRELMFGGRRFAQLRAGLNGISPNVLSQRLRELEAAGVVRRTTLDPVNVTLYELTDRGAALEPVLIELGRWGSQELNTSQQDLSVSALMFALKTVFDPTAARDASYAIRLGDETCTVTIEGGQIDVRRGVESDADVTFDTDVTTLRAVAFGREALADAAAAGRIAVTGDRRLAARFGRMFPVSPPRSAARPR